MEKVSIIVPVYNMEQYLEQCLEELTHQSYGNIEIIVVDDGSSDGTYKLAMDLAKKYPQIKVIHQEHQGVSVARNNGLEHSSGELLTFVDGDDSVEPNYVENLVDQLHHFDSDIAVSFYKLIDEQAGQFLVLMNPAPGNETYNDVYSPEQWLKNIGPVLNAETNSVWGKLYKRTIFNHLRFPEKFSFFEDGTTWWKACLSAKKISFLNQVDYTFRINRKGLERKPTDELKASIEVVRSFEEQVTMMNILGLDTTYLSGRLKNSLNDLKNKALAVSDYDYYQRATSALEVINTLEEEHQHE